MNNRILLFFFLLVTPLWGEEASSQKIKASYNSLDPTSIVQHFAFYELYPQSPEGVQALTHAWKLIGIHSSDISHMSLPSLDQTVHSMIALVNRWPDQKASQISDEALKLINKAASKLHNRQLKGYYAETESDVLLLPPEEIDLAHAIFLSQEMHDSGAYQAKKNYEAAIDLMALQIQARFALNASPEQKIRLINDFIFCELGFRFPPESLYVKEIDRYTFLSSVIDSRRGICLGVSVLYLALAQRLGLPLEIVTPPGHIYVRYRDKNKIINIETTARGINLESKDYLSIDAFALQERNLKETIGLVHFNQAADGLREESFDKALRSYEKAKLYLPNDCLVDELMGISSVLCGKVEEGKKLLRRAIDFPAKHLIANKTLCHDYLNGHADANALKVIMMHVDEQRDSILRKQKLLAEVVTQYPNGTSALFALAMTWIQLHRFGEALELLERIHQLDASDPKVEYYLSALYAERYNYIKAWEHLKIAEILTRNYGHFPKALKELKNALSEQCPDPDPLFHR